MKESIIITGIKGFLGKNLINLLKLDYNIIGIDIEDCFIGDIEVLSSNNIAKINKSPDFIIMCHAAVASGMFSPSVDELFNVNVKLTSEIIKLFPKAKIIYISTASIYKISKKRILENSEINPQSNYAISKLWAERVCNQEGVVLRLSSLFGIGMKENTIIPNYINQAIENNKIQVWGDGKRRQNYIHIKDVCYAIKASIENFQKVKGKTLLAVSMKEYSNIQLARIISKITKSQIEYCNEDHSISYKYNNKFTLENLNWIPQKNFKQEIEKYIKWKKK